MDATFTLEIEWSFQDPQTGWQIDDLVLTVRGEGYAPTGEIYGWEIVEVVQDIRRPDGKRQREAMPAEWPMVKALLEILSDGPEHRRLAAEVIERAQAQREAA